MSRKLTLEEIKEKLKDINSNVEIIDGVYINSATKLMCKCKIDDYEWGITWSHLKSGVGCPKCKGTAKLTLEEIKNMLKEINSNISIISTEYKNSKTKLECQCSIDNYKWEATWDNLKNSKIGCPKCINNVKGLSQKLTLKEVKENLSKSNPNIEIISKEYINSKTKLKCKCKIDSHEWETKYSHLQQGHGCPKCASRNNSDSQRFQLDKVKQILKEDINSDIIIIDDVYTDARTKLKCKCIVCEHEWGAIWSNLKKELGVRIAKP